MFTCPFFIGELETTIRSSPGGPGPLPQENQGLYALAAGVRRLHGRQGGPHRVQVLKRENPADQVSIYDMY